MRGVGVGRVLLEAAPVLVGVLLAARLREFAAVVDHVLSIVAYVAVWKNKIVEGLIL